MWAEKIKSHLIIEIVSELESKNYMQKKVLYDTIVKPLDENEEFLKMISEIGDNPFTTKNTYILINILRDTIIVSKEKTKLDDSIKNNLEKFKEKLNKDINFKDIVSLNLKRSLPEKELRTLKDFVIDHHINKIKSVIM